MSMNRDFARRESVMVIPSMDSVLDAFGRAPGPTDRRDQLFGFRKFSSNGDLDADYDRLMAWLAPGTPVRLVYQTDSGALWYTIGSNPKLGNPIASANNWGAGGYQDFSITWRIRPDWRPRFSESAEIFHSATTFAAGTTFGSVGTTVIASANQAFTVDARGTAGLDLPTIPDTGPTITIHGPAGGTGGMRVYNGTATATDTNGAKVPMYFDIPFQLPTADDSVTLKFAAQTFKHNGVPFRPLRPIDANGKSYQGDWWRVEAGVLNGCSVVALGASALTGGAIKVDWYRKRA